MAGSFNIRSTPADIAGDDRPGTLFGVKHRHHRSAAIGRLVPHLIVKGPDLLAHFLDHTQQFFIKGLSDRVDSGVVELPKLR